MKIWSVRNFAYLCNPKINGVIAQLVEQRTENPCVPGSIPGDTTSESESCRNVTLFFCAVLSPVSKQCPTAVILGNVDKNGINGKCINGKSMLIS